MCQINSITEMGLNDPSLNLKKKLQNTIKISGILLFLRKIQKTKTKKNILKIEGEKTKFSSSSFDLKQGDLVKVRSREQIEKTLDKNNKFEGCSFMEEMWQYCGSQQKVLKRVNHFFDERGAKLYKTRNIVLLEGVNCTGNQGILLPRCDRHCYVFWKEKWLEKIE